MENNWNKDSWNDRYLKNDTPWEDGEISPEMVQLFTHFTEDNASVLEIGCGLGTNAIWLAKQGYKYCGVDISEEAIKLASKNLEHDGLDANFITADILQNPPEEKFDVVFDKGCLHSLTNEEDRKKFANIVYDSLNVGGFWINISGNRDNPDRDGSVEEFGFPRLKASNLVSITEDIFQIHYMARCMYGSSNYHTMFLGWASVFQAR